MKKLTKILAMLLVLTLALSCICTQAFAADAENVRQYGKEGGFLAIGDSNFRGYGTAGYYRGEADTFTYREVEGASPLLVANAIGCTVTKMMDEKDSNYWPLCYPGQTLGMTMDIYGIEDNLTDTEFDFMYYDSMMKYFGYEGSAVGARGETYTTPAVVGDPIQLTKDASLIAVQLGMCDVFYRALRIASLGGSFGGGFNLNLDDPEGVANFVTDFLNTMYEGYDYWEEYFPVFLHELRQLNPEATIVIVGAYDMVEGVTLTEDDILPIGSAVAAITMQMNSSMRQWAEDYGCLFADISNTETAAEQYDWAFLGDFLKDADVSAHPTPEGHEYIARQILSVLSEEPLPSTYITVDLGRFDSVSYVMVNGKRIDDYTVENCRLVVPYTKENATSLTVAIVGEDGKVVVQTYTLSYDNGYTPYRIYATNDAAKTLTTAYNNIINIGKTIAQKLAGLFKK